MKRPLAVWLVFAVCSLTGLAVLGWFSREMLRLERDSERARSISAREENVRLALWRMDSALASVHGLEQARPPADYVPFRPAGATFTAELTPTAGTGPVMLPSPLLGYTPPFVRLHLEISADGRVSSPQAPEGAAFAAALRAAVPADALTAAAVRLEQLRGRIPAGALTTAHEPAVAPMESVGNETFISRGSPQVSLAAESSTEDKAALVPESLADAAPQVLRQVTEERKKNIAEQQQRAGLSVDNYYTMNSPGQVRDQRSVESFMDADAAAEVAETAERGATAPAVASALKAEASPPAAAAPSARRSRGPSQAQDFAAAEPAPDSPPEPTAAGPIQAAWVANELFFVRRVEGNGASRTQAVWLDWPELRAWLLGRVTDLLPDASLEPILESAAPGPDDASRRLAFLPVRLHAGSVSSSVSIPWTPLRTSLAIAWILAILGLLALAALLSGTLRLSERRGAFVSAVTHELRTPLTTFRMYTEMLAGGMVPDETKRRSYLDTLRKEAERLSHLVENVLSYARLERGRASRRVESTTPEEMISRIEERLRLRAEQGGLVLKINIAPEIASLPLELDTTAFEQIIFNLVDNAAKYARRPNGGGELCIDMTRAARGTRRLAVLVRDNGPGVAQPVRKRLFQPFSKSAAEAAHSQPGVGLGLALSRRLARDELRGELSLETTGPEGTVFRLEL